MPGSAPAQLLAIRKIGQAYVIELVEFVPAASTFEVRAVPASFKDGTLHFLGRQHQQELLAHDLQRDVMLGGVCKTSCRKIDEATYEVAKSAALAWKPKKLSDFAK